MISEEIMSNKELILVIENDESWREKLKEILLSYGEDREIIKLGYNDFITAYNKNHSFDNVAYCFVDLELGPKSNREMNDTWGLDKVLPHIRRLAPWIPVACLSMYIDNDFPGIIYDLSFSDFDVFYPKRIIYDQEHKKTNPDFNQNKWQNMLQQLSIKRVATMSGRSVEEIKRLLNDSKNMKLTLSESTQPKITEFGEGKFKEGLALMDFGSLELSINELVQGFSGINVGKLSAYGRDDKGEIHSYWLIKWGKPIRKLAEEAEAHHRMFQRGIDRSLQVPQLHHKAISWNGMGYLAYSYEDKALTALEFVHKNEVKGLVPHMNKITSSLYSKSHKGSVSPRRELEKWCGVLNDKELEALGNDNLNHPLESTFALIHGDLHLRNILITDGKPTLIDFARSDSGPIVIDLAKLLIDILVFCEDAQQIKSEMFKWDTIKTSSLGCLLSVFEKYVPASDDIKFFELAIKAYALKYLTYPDVKEDRKKAISEALRVK